MQTVSIAMNYSLAVLCALEIEADPIIRSFKMVEQHAILDPRLRLRFFASETMPEISLILFGNCPINNINRIGSQIASIAAWETIRCLNPKMLASVGTAGGFKTRGAQIGDVYISEGPIYFHGRHIPVPAYQGFEVGKFPSVRLNTDPHIKRGVISSGDSIPPSAFDLEKMNLIETDAKDMEAAAVAEVAYLASVPMFALKSISDFVDSHERTHDQFIANYKIAAKNLADSLELIIANRLFDRYPRRLEIIKNATGADLNALDSEISL